MPNIKLCLALVLVTALFSSAAAQESTTAKTTLPITANATGERVRITAPSSVVQMHVEIYAANGEKLFDQEIRGGNVFDWHLQDGQAQRLAPGAYVCVVTAKSVSGKITQKLGTVTVAEKSASVQTGAQQLSPQQTQAIGPVEADSSWTIAGENELQTPTVIANDGTDGQMIRGRGALTFRVGNFFSGIDTEQMRLTETGDLGIGTSQPQSKLEVAGTIRAERFLVVKPKLGNGDKTAAASQATDATDGVQPLVAGTGTENQIAKWTDNAGTLGDSVITETPAGRVGVGITIPLSKFHVSSTFDALRLTSTNDTTPVWAQFNTSLGSGLGYFGVEGNTPGIFLAGTLPYATALSSGGSGTALQLGSAGSVKMTILSGGNVGIGTVNPTARLQVVGDLLFENKWRTETTTVNPGSVPGPPNLIGGFLGTGSGGATPGNRVTPGVVGATIGGGGFNGTFNYPSGAGSLGDFTNRVTDWFGTVGGGLFNLAGNNDTVLDNAFYATVSGGFGNTASGSHATVGGGFFNVASGNFSFAAGTRAVAQHPGAFVWADSISASNFSSSAPDQFLIRASGGVGIGTSTPVGRLNVVGSGGSGQGIQFDNREIKFRGEGDAHYSIFANRIPGTLTIEDTSSDFGMNTAGTVLLAITKGSGNIGLGGITAPTSKLQVNGQGRFSTVNIDSYVAAQSLPLCTANSGVNQNLIGLCTSSLRYKKNVQPFRQGLSIINRLRPISFDWKDGGLQDLGLAAEEVDKVEPMLTFHNEKGEIQGVRYNQLAAVFINAFKEQQQEIMLQQAAAKHQQEQIDALRKANDTLNARLQSIERALKNKRGSTRQRH